MKFSASLISSMTAACLMMQATAAPVEGSRPTSCRHKPEQWNPSLAPASSAQVPPKKVDSKASKAESNVPQTPSASDTPASPLSLVSTGVRTVGTVPGLLGSLVAGAPTGEVNNLVGSGQKTSTQAENPPKSPSAAENNVQNDSTTVTDTQKDAAKEGKQDVAKDTKTTEKTTSDDTPKAASEVPAETQGGGKFDLQKNAQGGPRAVTRSEILPRDEDAPVKTFDSGSYRQTTPVKGGEY
ncbi:hypothetical protein QCA50_004105 [Cerrena zonata]|uniref:Uncharacterized protein n=1 Tax=Cerrena zonata TaxID=2478898 RepID=A0AAW0GN15_9APHY